MNAMHGNATCVGFLGWPAGFGRPVGRGYANNHILSENGWFEAMPFNSQVSKFSGFTENDFSKFLYLAVSTYTLSILDCNFCQVLLNYIVS